MKTFREEDLIAYHLGELSWWKRRWLRHRLQVDAQLAQDSEEIAATLRAFSSDPPPVASAATVERSWQRMRGCLSALDAAPQRNRAWISPAALVGAASVIAIAILIAVPRRDAVEAPGSISEAGAPSARSVSQRLFGELHREKPRAEPYNHRPGPLTTGPVDAVLEDRALAEHLDAAERVLTEVTHADGPLQPETREQVHRLLLKNAVYRQSAEQQGDMETAAVIDDLGRVLISLDAEPLDTEKEQRTHNPDAFRLEMNLGSVLLDLRILHHNDRPNQEQ